MDHIIRGAKWQTDTLFRRKIFEALNKLPFKEWILKEELSKLTGYSSKLLKNNIREIKDYSILEAVEINGKNKRVRLFASERTVKDWHELQQKKSSSKSK